MPRPKITYCVAGLTGRPPFSLLSFGWARGRFFCPIGRSYHPEVMFTQGLNRVRRGLRARRGLDQPSYAILLDEAAALLATSELGRLAVRPRAHPLFKWVHYFDAYEREFQPWRGRPVRMLEIGVYRGGSLGMWRDYFGPDSIIFGVDIDQRCADLIGSGGEIRIGSQGDAAFLRSVVAEMGGVDIVLDDGSHQGRHQRASFETLWPLLSDEGVYAVEDLQTAYWRDYGPPFTQYALKLVDDMHGWYHRRRRNAPEIAAHATVDRVTFYDSIMFLHKTAKRRPANFYTG